MSAAKTVMLDSTQTIKTLMACEVIKFANYSQAFTAED